jgi:hypothetical protein
VVVNDSSLKKKGRFIMSFPKENDVVCNSYKRGLIDVFKMKEGRTVIVIQQEISNENLQKISAIIKALCE